MPGRYDKLVEKNLLIPHQEIDLAAIEHFPGSREEIYKIIKPEHVPFISYPYEWCFSQLQHQALALPTVEKIALTHGMSLKDASAFNMQFRRGKPVLIDTLSFEKYAEGEPWVAYGQFCRHFLAPLALVKYRDPRLNTLSRIHLDGVPLDLAASLLPATARLRPPD